jgi:WD40 repeat protein
LGGKGRTTRRLRAPTDVFDVAASPDAKLLAIRTRGRRVFEVAGGETILELPEGTAYVTFSRDGALLAVVYPGEGALWDLRSRELLHTFGHATEPYRARIDGCPPAFSPGGDLIAFGQSVFETSTGALKWRALNEAWTRAAIFSPERVASTWPFGIRPPGRSSGSSTSTATAYARWRFHRTGGRWPWRPPTPAKSTCATSQPERGSASSTPTPTTRAVAFSPDGATVFTGAADRTIRLWDPRTSRLRATLPPPAR